MCKKRKNNRVKKYSRSRKIIFTEPSNRKLMQFPSSFTLIRAPDGLVSEKKILLYSFKVKGFQRSKFLYTVICAQFICRSSLFFKYDCFSLGNCRHMSECMDTCNLFGMCTKAKKHTIQNHFYVFFLQSSFN